MSKNVVHMSDAVLRALENGEQVQVVTHQNISVEQVQGDRFVTVRGNVNFWQTVLTALAISAKAPGTFTYPFESVHNILLESLTTDMQRLNEALDV